MTFVMVADEFRCHTNGHDKLRYNCMLKCTRTRATCAHPCPKPCHEACGDCMEPVEHKLPCGHTIIVPCFTDVSTVECNSICNKSLPCGHLCTQKCGLPCDNVCTTRVKKTLPLCNKNPPHWKLVDCGYNVDNDMCTVECGGKLSCGHICKGSCADCNKPSGCRHVDCMTNCGRSLDCNHRCDGSHPCGGGSVCPPCSSPCEVVCSHGKCKLLCGEACIPCREPCEYVCQHTRCNSLCFEAHSVMTQNGQRIICGHGTAINSICDSVCGKLLSCQHPCRGVCGELCPRVCAVCNAAHARRRFDYLRKRTSSTYPRLVELVCGHSFDVEALDDWVNSTPSAAGNVVPVCPECKRTIMGVYRYSSMVCSRLALLTPGHLLAREKQLCLQVTADINEKRIRSVIERLESMLSRQSTSSVTNSLGPAILLLLGQAYLSCGKNQLAITTLEDALKLAQSKHIKREALISLGICRGGFLSNAFKSMGKEHLEKAMDNFSRSLENNVDSTILTAFSKNNSEVQEFMSKITARLAQLKTAEDIRNSEKALKMQQTAKLQQEREAQHLAELKQKEAEAARIALTQKSRSSTTAAVSDGSPLHMAASRGLLREVQDLIREGADTYKKDSLGNTALLCAAENACWPVIQYLMPRSPWHTLNLAKKAFLDVVMSDPIKEALGILAVTEIDNAASETMLDDQDIDPSHAWAAAKFYEACDCLPLDELMDMVGIKGVKTQALDLFHTIRKDMQRKPEARISAKKAMNFLFLGNPGTGKTTAARIFGQILTSLQLRAPGKFLETSGQKLLQEGQSKFPATLKSVIPGILFVDEVYQLEPAGNADGKAITNAIMEATENHRSELTVIVAGYRDDVQEKWVSWNPGLQSRFPIEVVFDDFSESEMRKIFVDMVRSFSWVIQNYTWQPEPESESGEFGSGPVTVDVALIAARRLARAANKKGFANARSVRVLVEKAMSSASKRQQLEQIEAKASRRTLPPDHETTLTLPDVIGSPVDPSSSPLIKELMAMTGLQDVKNSVKGLLQIAIDNYKSELKGEGVLDISLHRMFLGNPGTYIEFKTS